METPKVCAVILNYNGRAMLDTFLGSFRKTRYPDYHVIVVDNGTTDGSMAGFRDAYPWVDLLTLNENHGFSGGNNAGIRYAVDRYDPDFVVLLNNDMEVTDPLWMGELVRAAETEPRAGVVGCKLLLRGGIIQHAGGRFSALSESYHPGMGEKDDRSHDLVEDADYVTGACLLITRGALEKAGLLDERYNPIYFEDAEYCARLRRSGFRVIYDGKASLMHYHGRTPLHLLWRQEPYYRNWTRNRIRFVLYNLPFWWWPLIFPRIFLGAFIGRNGDGSLALMPSPLSRLGIVIGGFLSALAHPSPLNIRLAPPKKL